MPRHLWSDSSWLEAIRQLSLYAQYLLQGRLSTYISQIIWSAARRDKTAYPALRTAFEKNLVFDIYLHADLAWAVRRLKPRGGKMQLISHSRPSSAVIISLALFLTATVLNVIALLCTCFSRLRFPDVYKPVACSFDTIHVAYLQYLDPMDAYTLEIFNVSLVISKCSQEYI